MCHKIICDQYFFSLDRSHRKQHVVDKEQVLERAQELLVEKMSLVEDDE